MRVLNRWNLAGLAAALLALSPALARADDAVTYSSSERVFKVGVLLVDSTIIDVDNDGVISPGEKQAGPENSDPYVFYIADQRKDVKPLGWTFANPLSPKTVTTDVYNRWIARDSTHPYRVGDAVQKNMAAYWEVSLSKTPIADLLQYDALLLTTHTLLRFSLTDREKLRKLVDAGGNLWLDDCGGMRVDYRGPFFLDQLQFQGSRGGDAAGSGPAIPFVFQPEHPILNSPYHLSLQQISKLGEYSDYRNRSLGTLEPTGGATLQQSPNPSILTNVVGNQRMGGLPYIAVASYGSGAVVATCGDTGCAINDYVGGNRNDVRSGPNSGAYLNNGHLENAHTEDLLFLYNLVQLGGSNAAFRRNDRRVGASTENLSAPLTSTFDFTQAGTPTDAPVNSSSAPLVVHDRVYVAGLDNNNAVTVRCYNAKPSYSRGDEGVPDLAFGASYDEVWRATYSNPVMGRQPSTPVLATVYDAVAKTYTDYIFVNLPDGTVLRMPALPRDASGNALPVNTPVAAAVELIASPTTYTNIPAGGSVPAPVFYENRLYVAQPDGVVRCLDANSLGTLWKSIESAPTEEITPTGTPTLGIIQLSDSTGTRGGRQANLAAKSDGSTNDVVLYVPVLNTANGSGRMLPFWLGARHEVADLPTAPGSGDYPLTRVYGPSGNNPYWVANAATGAPAFTKARARVYDSRTDMENGVPSGTYSASAITDNGLVQVRDAGGTPPPSGVALLVSADYDLLYVPGSSGPMLGTPPGLSAGSTGARAVGNPALDAPNMISGMETAALAPDDTLFFVAQQSSGAPATATKTSLFGTHEQFGNGATKLRQSFTVLEGSTNGIQMPYSLPNGSSGTLIEAPSFRNPFAFSGGPDKPVTLLPGLGIGLQNVVPVGPPTLSATDGLLYVLMRGSAGGVPVTVVAAYDPDKEVTLHLKPYDGTKGVTIQQIDALSEPSADLSTDPLRIVTAALPAQTGDGTVSTGILEGDAESGKITIKNMSPGQGRFSSSQTFLVTYTPRDRQQPITVPVAPSSRVQTANGGGTDVVDPALPRQDFDPLLWYYVLPGTPSGGLSRVGGNLYYSSNFGIVALDADPASGDPDVRPAEPIRSISHVRWVSGPTGAASAPVAGSEVLAVNTAGGTFAFENSTTLVADGGRIIEVGGDGTPLWSMDATVDYKVVGGDLPIFDPINPVPGNGRQVFERRALSRPAVARRLGGGDYLIADTGNNRLVRTSRSATVTWELTRVADPLQVLRSGDPLTLNNPTDVHVYTHPTLDASGKAIGYEEHYLIADAGNYRLLEVVDYHDPSGAIRTIGGVAGEKVVVWATRTATEQGRRLRFKSAQRVYTNTATASGIPTLVATIDNASASGESASVGSDFSGGSLVRLDYRPINTFFLLRDAAGTPIPPVGTGVWATTGLPSSSGYPWVSGGTEPPLSGRVSEVLDLVVFKAGTLMPDGSTLAVDRKYRITRPTYFQQLTLRGTAPGVGQKAFIICDANGVYQVEPQASGENVVTWFFNALDYGRINALDRINVQAPGATFPLTSLPAFLPTSAERLPNGHMLISNGASGPSSLFDDGQFRGEVLEVTASPRYAPMGTPGLPRYGSFSAPAWSVTQAGGRATIKQRMGASSATHPLEQPLFADRL